MAITGSQKALMFAIGGVARGGATRGGYHSARTFVAIGGVQYATARPVASAEVLADSLSITETLGQPSTALFTCKGFTPAVGSEVVVTLGSINSRRRLFGGTILTVDQGYVDTLGNQEFHCSAIDFTWSLDRTKVLASYTNQFASDIAISLVAGAAGFTTAGISTALPLVDAITFTNVGRMDALRQLAARVGAFVKVDYLKDVHLFVTDATETNPIDLTPTHPTMEGFAELKDLGPVITRVLSEGGGSTVLGACAVGETILPVAELGWYEAAGGIVTTGQQRITYTATAPGGSGSLVGPGAAPTVLPTLTLKSGAGIEVGVHGYAYTFVTAAGESLPSPVRNITDYAAIGAGAAPGLVLIPGTPAMTPGTYEFLYTYWIVGGGESIGSASGTITVPGGTYAVSVQVPASSDPRVSQAKIYARTPSGSGTFQWSAETLGSWGVASVSTIGSAGAYSGTNTTQQQQVGISVPLGPTGTTARKIYRTVAGGTQLKLQQTIANNTATAGVQDATPDASLGANAPTSDTSALTQPSGTVLAGSTSILLAGAGAFSPTGGWAVVGGSQAVRYTGITGNTLTGIPASGFGSITTSISYNTAITASPGLTGVPASGAGSVIYPILQGANLNLLVQVDDLTAQATRSALLDPSNLLGGAAGIEEEYLSDGRIGHTEALARATALLLERGYVASSIRFTSRDTNVAAGATQGVNLPAPTNVVASYKIQTVSITAFSSNDTLMPTYSATGARFRFAFTDLLSRKG